MQAKTLSHNESQIQWKKGVLFICIKSVHLLAFLLKSGMEFLLILFKSTIKFLESLEQISEIDLEINNIKEKLTERACKLFGVNDGVTNKDQRDNKRKNRPFRKWTRKSIRIATFPIFILMAVVVESLQKVKKWLILFTKENST